LQHHSVYGTPSCDHLHSKKDLALEFTRELFLLCQFGISKQQEAAKTTSIPALYIIYIFALRKLIRIENDNESTAINCIQ